MYAQRLVIPVTTIADGSATAYSSETITGRIINVMYNKTDFVDGVDFTITSETTAQNIWTELNVNAAKTIAPRQPTHDSAGLASFYAAAGEPVEDYIVLVQERIKIVIAQGGSVKSGAFIVIVG
jgi:hypothetical protein